MPSEQLPFRANENALIKLGDSGSAPIINYNVPQPAEYNGRHYLELEFDNNIWSPQARLRTNADTSSSGGSISNTGTGATNSSSQGNTLDEIRRKVDEIIDRWKDEERPPLSDSARDLSNNIFLPAFDLFAYEASGDQIPLRNESLPTWATKDEVISTRASEIQPHAVTQEETAARPEHLKLLDNLVEKYGHKEFAKRIDEGGNIVMRRKLDSSKVLDIINASSPTVTPKIAIIESCRMSSFLGDYGAGKTIGTMSLLPGERHEISIKTFKRTKTKETEASSILDSYEETTADEFSNDLKEESSNRSSEKDHFSGHVEAEASANWGWGKAKVSGGVEKGSSSEREEFAKNVSGTTQKHAASAASKRQMEINSTTETETEQSEERAIKRTIENINVGRTLNFVFRQMIQKFVTVLYIIDVRIGFHNGDPTTYREFTLAEIDKFLDEMVEPAHHQSVRKAIHDAIFYTFDWKGEHRPLVEAVKHAPNANQIPLLDPPTGEFTYWRFRRHQIQLDRNEDGIEVEIPGVVIGVTQSTLPTDGVIAEALLGQGNALDAYSLGLQSESVRTKVAENDLSERQIIVNDARLEAVTNNDAERASLLEQLFPPTEEEPQDV